MVISQAIVIAYGVRETGEREVLGIDIGLAKGRRLLDRLLAGAG